MMKGKQVIIDGNIRIFDGEGNPLNEIAELPHIDKVFQKPALSRQDAKDVIRRYREERLNWNAKKLKEQKKKAKKKGRKK
jgi:hypothetical protein